MTMHTPGPWDAFATAQHEIRITTGGPAGHLICTLPIRRNPGRVLINLANGRLIAAAPDMLAALEKAVAGYRVYTHADQAVLDQMRAAIAKARGEG